MGDLSHLNSVLIVEDDFLIGTDLELVLKHRGAAEPEVVGSCGLALERVASENFDLVTVDVRLSDGNCHGLVEELGNRGIPFVYVTGCEPAELPQPAPLVTKPFDDDELVDAVLSVTTETGQQPRAGHQEA